MEGEKKMSEIKITKEKIKKLHDKMESCGEAQDAIREAFPEAFEEKWIDVTGNLKFRPHKACSFYWIGIFKEGKDLQIGWLDNVGANICTHAKKDYKIEGHSWGNCFRILKRGKQ